MLCILLSFLFFLNQLNKAVCVEYSVASLPRIA